MPASLLHSGHPIFNAGVSTKDPRKRGTMTEEMELAFLCKLGEIEGQASRVSQLACAQGRLPLAEKAGRLRVFLAGERFRRQRRLL